MPLIDIVKTYLDITWIDEQSEKKLQLMIDNAKADLDEKSGIENDYEKEGRAQTLLLTRIMYERSNALDDFYKNYRNEIIAFINKAKVDKYVNKSQNE